MPQAKPITRKRRPAAALSVSKPSRTHLPNGALTISAMAAEIAHLRSLASKMDAADTQQTKLLEELNDVERRRLPVLVIRFDELQRNADARARALEDLILTTEPDSLDEALSLALIMLCELDGVVDKTGDVEDAMTGLCGLTRWMIRAGATSPLRAHYYVGTRLNDDAVEKALVRADEILRAIRAKAREDEKAASRKVAS